MTRRYIKAGDSLARFAAEMEEFLNRIDKYYDAIMEAEHGAGAFYHYLGEDRNDKGKEIYALSKYLSHRGMGIEILATLDNAIEALEKMVAIDYELSMEGYTGVYPTQQMDSLYMFAYQMIKDSMSEADELMQMTPKTLAYMGVDLADLDFPQ